MKTIYSDDYIGIITSLRAMRLKKNIKQEDLANLLGFQQSFVSKVENRERRLDVIEFLSWIDALGVTVEDIVPQKYTRKKEE